MEDRRAVIGILLLTVICSSLVYPASGYNNVAAHPMINKYAVITFERDLMPNDAYLKTASLNGAPAYGTDWNLSDGRKNVPSQGIISIFRGKPPALWIIDGGFSADEPEYWQSLRHFYDPLNSRAAYLTDTRTAQWAGYVKYGDEMANPGISALDWAFEKSSANIYSYPYAKMYFTKALESDERNNEYYGKAWRAAGETMHMVSDMTVPAHVRNDGHPISEPYEDSVTGEVIEKIANSGAQPVNLDYRVAPRTLMDKVAGFTNTRFLSADSVFSYTQPDITEAPADNGYIMMTLNDQPIRVARVPSLFDQLFENPPPPALPHVDRAVVMDQQKILIPTAVRASAAVLDRFLPRFKVTGSITVKGEEEYGDTVPVYYLNGKIDLVGNREEWPETLTIRNGASLVNAKTGKRLSIPVNGIVSGSNLNSFTYIFVPEVELGAEPGDTVYLEYDLGGYVVRSEGMKIPSWEKTPTPTATTKAKTTTRTLTPVITTPAPKTTTSITTTVPTPKPTLCYSKSPSDRDCECLCRCYQDSTERAKCVKDCSGGYAIFACPYG